MLGCSTWLIEESARAELAALAARTPEARRVSPSARAAESSALEVAGSTATITVRGVLLPTRSWLLDAFGVAQTGYDEILDAVSQARADRSVTTVRFDITSPGGAVDGLFETLDAVRALRAEKRRTSVISGLAASAAYALAAAAGPITARTEADAFGSIGIVGTYALNDRLVDITSTDAPDKRPDPKTEEGRATIRAYLDQLHGLFAEAIAAGRGVSVETVNANYGRGGVMTARAALKAAMIDSIASKTTTATANGKAASMPRPQHAFDIGDHVAAQLAADLKKKPQGAPGGGTPLHDRAIVAFLAAADDWKPLEGAAGWETNARGHIRKAARSER
jgi:capsid assembly protease